MKISDNASYLLAHPDRYAKEPIVKNREIVREMDKVFRENGWPMEVSTGSANWLFYGNREGYRMRLKNKLYLECSRDYYGSAQWFTVRTWTVKKTATAPGLAKVIARHLNSYFVANVPPVVISVPSVPPVPASCDEI